MTWVVSPSPRSSGAVETNPNYELRKRTLRFGLPAPLFTINMDAGHGGASGRHDHWKEVATDYAFVLWQLGLLPLTFTFLGLMWCWMNRAERRWVSVLGGALALGLSLLRRGAMGLGDVKPAKRKGGRPFKVSR